ncbi:MAG: efflux RND transporter periplasmic adaptor subunit [Myxococcota bacterium]
MSKARKMLQPLLVVLVIGAGAGIMLWLKSTKPQADRVETEERGRLVEVSTVKRGRHEVAVRAQGTVMPARRVVIQPELNGRVVWQNSNLVPGGRLQKGDRIIRIDARDYALALESRKADVSRAKLELKLERSRQEVAKREWDEFGTPEEQEADGGTLALRDPQVKTAAVAVDSARSAYDQAKLNLEKTLLKAPFNALVMQENVDEGQLVGTQTQVATLVGTDRFWVQVSVPVDALPHIRTPDDESDEGGSVVRVWQDVGGERVERTGRVLRILPDLDEGGAMARILVGIDDPLGLEASDEETVSPMLLNSYVNVEIDAPPIDDVIQIPRTALRDGSRVYVMDEEGKLRIREVQLAWRQPDSVLVRSGLKEGEQLVVSRVPAPVEGMDLRTAKEDDGREHSVAEADAEAEPERPGEEKL